MADYAALLAELDLLKAQPAPKADDKDDDKIAAAAAEGGVDTTKVAAEGKGEGDDPDGAAGDGAAADAVRSAPAADKNDDKKDCGPMGKSFSVKLEDGTETEAYDATEMLKAFSDEIAGVKDGAAMLATALQSTVAIIKDLKTEAEKRDALVKSLAADVAKLGAAPVGRKAVLHVHDKQVAGAETKPAGIAYPDVMIKALALQREGVLGANEVSTLVAHANRGLGIPPELAHHFLPA